MVDIDDALVDPLAAWRAIILYGQNTATYKIALGQALKGFVDQGLDRVTLEELSTAFLDLYVNRLRSGKPQQMTAGRLTAMERIVGDLTRGAIDREEAVARVGAQAFGDVIPRFHTVRNRPVPVPFYEIQSKSGLVLTDASFKVFELDEALALTWELGFRWNFLETAFELNRESGSLTNDIRAFYLAHGYERTRIADLAPVLHAYQEGRCF